MEGAGALTEPAGGVKYICPKGQYICFNNIEIFETFFLIY